VRVYYAKFPDATGNQAFVGARQPNGTWAEASLLPGVPVQRLAVIQRGETDHLYLVAPTAYQLYYGVV
jgi:hypothetical protein